MCSLCSVSCLNNTSKETTIYIGYGQRNFLMTVIQKSKLPQQYAFRHNSCIIKRSTKIFRSLNLLCHLRNHIPIDNARKKNPWFLRNTNSYTIFTLVDIQVKV